MRMLLHVLISWNRTHYGMHTSRILRLLYLILVRRGVSAIGNESTVSNIQHVVYDNEDILKYRSKSI